MKKIIHLSIRDSNVYNRANICTGFLKSAQIIDDHSGPIEMILVLSLDSSKPLPITGLVDELPISPGDRAVRI